MRTGFASSLKWCFEQAEGKFVWLLSDDDPIFWDGFCRLLALIKLDKADCYIVPIKWVTFFNETRVDQFTKFSTNESFSVDQMFLDDLGIVQMKPLPQSQKKMRSYYWKYRQKPNYLAMVILMLPPVFSRIWYYVVNAMDYVRVYGAGASVLRKCQLTLVSNRKLKTFAIFRK